VQDPARIMRLAGTVNYPTLPKKQERGYVPELVKLVRKEVAPYKVDRLTGLGATAPVPPGATVDLGDTWDDFIKELKDGQGRTDEDILALLNKVGGPAKWHVPMLSVVATLIGRGWTDFQIKGFCAPYADGGIDDGDVDKLIETGRKKFDKPNGPEGTIAKAKPAPKPIHATPYVWKDPGAIPQRDWVYGRTLIRKIVSATISPGGIGKSSLIAAEALAMVSGKALLGVELDTSLRVWLWNLEDPQEETERKIQAAALHYELSPDDIGDRLLVDSGRDQKLVIATTTRDGAMIVQPVVDSLVSEIIAHGVDVLVIDPFVSCHEVAENDNSAMDMVVKEWGRVAERGNCAVHLVHHTRKMGDAVEVTTESSRGGSSQTDAVRVVRVVNRMTKEQAKEIGIDNPRSYFRTLNDKGNFAPPVDKSDWFELVSVNLGNGPMGMDGDSVGVVTEWQWPDMTAGMTPADYDRVAAEIRGGEWRDNVQAKNWAGKAIADALGLDLEKPTDRGKVKAALKMYLKAGSLIVVERRDEQRKSKNFIEVGPGQG
jgi:AAA domain